MHSTPDRTTRRSTKAAGGRKKTPRGDKKTGAYLVRFKKPTASMVKLAKLEAMDHREWNVEGVSFMMS